MTHCMPIYRNPLIGGRANGESMQKRPTRGCPHRVVRMLVGAAVWYAPLGPVHALDLVQSYEAAAARDPILASARAAHQGGIEIVEQAQAKLGATVQASAYTGLVQSHLQGFPQTSGSTAQGTLTLDQPLYHRADSVGIDEAHARVAGLDAQLAGAEQDLVLRVAQAYLSTLLAQDLLEATHREQQSIAKQLEQAQRSYEIGTVPITDVSDARARYDITNATEVQNRSDMDVARHALEQLTGLQAEFLAGISVPAALRSPMPADLQYWISAALAHSPTVLQARATLDTQEKEIDHSRAARFPTLDLVANVSRENYSQTGLDITGTAGRSAQVGLLLSLPIWDGGLRNSGVRQALAGAEQARDDLQASQDAVTQTARQLYTGVLSALAQAHALEQAVSSGQLSLEGSLRGQQVGTRTAVDVLNARQLLFQAERQLAAARYMAILQLLQLRAVAGELSAKDLEGITSASSTSALFPSQ